MQVFLQEPGAHPAFPDHGLDNTRTFLSYDSRRQNYTAEQCPQGSPPGPSSLASG